MTMKEAYRQLGVCIQEDPRYVAYTEKQKAAKVDPQVDAIGNNLGELMAQYEQEAVKENKDMAAMESIQAQYQELYKKFYEVPAMSELMDAKEQLDEMMNEIMNYIYLVIGGADPMTAEVTPDTMAQMREMMMSQM